MSSIWKLPGLSKYGSRHFFYSVTLVSIENRDVSSFLNGVVFQIVQKAYSEVPGVQVGWNFPRLTVYPFPR